MARKVIWSYEAANDLEAIAAYIGKNTEFYAAAFVRQLLDASRSLAWFAERGRIVPELDDQDIRENFVYSYRLIYNIEDKRVVIIAVIHGARDLNALWDRERSG